MFPQYGLRFNPNKTSCMIAGENPLTIVPSFYMGSSPLHVVDSISYLGPVLGNKGSHEHVNNRISACRKAFYALQGG